VKPAVVAFIALAATVAHDETPARPDPAKIAALKEHARQLKAGRARARAKDWPAAAAALDAALAAAPGEGWALTERGYVALMAGDLELAGQHTAAATRDPRPRVQGAAHYNLGQLAEKRGATDAAIAHYLASHEAWPSVAAAGRVTALGGTVPHPGTLDETAPACGKPVRESQLCGCIVAGLRGEADPDDEILCERATVEKPARGLAVLAATLDAETTLHLAERTAAGWVVVGTLATVYLGGVAGVNGDWALARLERRKLGATEVAWVEIAEERSDNDLGIDEVTFESTRHVTVCRLGAGARCVLGVPVEHSILRERLGAMEDEELDPETRANMTKNLPQSGSIKLRLAVDPAGVATISRVSEKASAGVDLTRFRRYVGQVKLW
jgi:hypothetical protein